MEQKELEKYLSRSQRKLADIAKEFSLSEDEAKSELQYYLDSGLIFDTIKGYMLLKDAKVSLGTLVTRKDNYAFVRPIGTDSKKDDVRVAGRSLDGYILDDEVYYQIDNWGCGTIAGLFKRNPTLSGRIVKRPNGEFFLLSKRNENTNIDIHVSKLPEDMSDGDLIKAKIITSSSDVIETEYQETLAKASDVGVDISTIIASNDAPLTFPDSVLTQARMIGQTLSEEDIKDREDFRNQTIVTIDGEDALDFDDAVSCEKIVNGFRIGVYIADVSYYVRPNTPLDEEAQKRGTSIYVADRVVPMLPKELSNGICSLNPNVDRLVQAVIMDVDESGNVYRSRFSQGVICSKGRLTYKQVNNLFAANDRSELSDAIVQMLFLMKQATDKIRFRRNQQGALNLDSTELKFVLDENGVPTEVIKRTQGEGESLIEDLMISANVEVAKYLDAHKIPTLYRIHDNPPSEKLELFKQFLRTIKLSFSFPKTITPSSISHWYNTISDPDVKQAVSPFLLKSLAKAKYSPDNSGHFGLAEQDYLHFTSPIRRYPDLIVHRTLRNYVFNKEKFNYDKLHQSLESLGDMTSACERRAVSIEREVDDLESCKYMKQHLNEKFAGVVTGMNAKGLFVELENGIEVSVALKDIDPYQHWIYSESHMDIQNNEKDENGRLTLFRLGSKMDLYAYDVTFEDKTVHAMSQQAKDYDEAYQDYLKQTEDDSYWRASRADFNRFSGRTRHFDDSYKGQRGRPLNKRRDEDEYEPRDDRDDSREESNYSASEEETNDDNCRKNENNEDMNNAKVLEADDNQELTRFVSSTDSMDAEEAKRRMNNTRPARRGGYSSGGRSSYGRSSSSRGGSRGGYGRSSYGDRGHSSYGRSSGGYSSRSSYRDDRGSSNGASSDSPYKFSDKQAQSDFSSDRRDDRRSDRPSRGYGNSSRGYSSERGGRSFGEHRSFNRGRQDDSRSSNDRRSSYGDRGDSSKSYGDRGHSSYGDRKSSYGSRGGHSSYGDKRSSYGDRKSYGDERSFGEKKSFGHSSSRSYSSSSRGGYSSHGSSYGSRGSYRGGRSPMKGYGKGHGSR